MYESQYKARSTGSWIKHWGRISEQMNFTVSCTKKHFKKTYAGKPTKRYLRIIEHIQRAESIPHQEIGYVSVLLASSDDNFQPSDGNILMVLV